jgi:hypothetical protein
MNSEGCGRKWSWPNLRYYSNFLFMYSPMSQVQLTLKVLKFKTLNCFSFYVLFNTSTALDVSAYLAIVRCITLLEELLHFDTLL